MKKSKTNFQIVVEIIVICIMSYILFGVLLSCSEAYGQVYVESKMKINDKADTESIKWS
jgi:hypothetical protein